MLQDRRPRRVPQPDRRRPVVPVRRDRFRDDHLQPAAARKPRTGPFYGNRLREEARLPHAGKACLSVLLIAVRVQLVAVRERLQKSDNRRFALFI